MVSSKLNLSMWPLTSVLPGPVLCAALLLMMMTQRAVAADRCCGDCDGDGVIRINELVRAVDAAVEACPLAPKMRLQLVGSIPYGLQVTLDRPAVEGRVAFTLTDPAPELQALFFIRMSTAHSPVGLVLDKRTLRLFIDTFFGGDSGANNVVEIELGDWSGSHRIKAAWGRGELLLSVDGRESVVTGPNEIIAPTGARVRFGSPGEATGPRISDISFATD